MNKILKSLALVAILSLGFLATSCVEELQDELTEMNLRRCLEPLNLNAKITDGDQVTFSWDLTKGAEKYRLEIFKDKAMSSLVKREELTDKDVPYTIKLEADASYYFRVQASAPGSTKDPSNWAVYEKEIKTYAVKSPLFLKVSDRTTQTISFTWNQDPEVDRIELLKEGEEAIVRELNSLEVEAARATINNLDPATNYVATLYFKSASRGEVNVWTRPNIGEAISVNSTASLLSAIAAKEPMIYLRAEGSPYEIGTSSVELLAGINIIGEETLDGTRPKIVGEFCFPASFEGGAVRFESIEFNGQSNTFGFAIQLKNGGTAAGLAIEGIEYKNCTLTGYSKGLIYEWGQTFNLGYLKYDGCTIYAINEDGSGGGDVIDLRGASEIGAIDICNSTIYNGFRTFVRLDANVRTSAVRLVRNTIMNVCFVDNSNNSGLIGIKNEAKPAELKFSDNLLLYMTGKSSIVNTNDKNTAEIAISNNYYYGCVDDFFARVTQAAALAGGGRILSADPCFNAKGGVFNLTNSDVSAAKVGAPVWWTPFIEEPEDLTIPLIDGAHTWDFTDAKYFVGDITKSKVRDGLFMSVTDNALRVEDGVMVFPAASLVSRKGVPTDGFLAFQVDAPGSLYLKPSDIKDAGGNDIRGNHIIVGVGDLNGTTNRIKGGAAMNVDMSNAQKILISDISEPSLVYVYASGPIGLAELAWSLDTDQVNTALPAPSPSVAPASVTQGASKPIVVSWSPISNAGSYSLVFGGKTYLVEDGALSYTIPAEVVRFLDAGGYMINVYANPAEGDIYNTQSSAGSAALAVLPDGAAGGGEFIVSSVEDLVNAIASGKTAITLEANSTPYELGALEISTPLHLKGQNGGTRIAGANFTLVNDIDGSVILEDLIFDGTGTTASFMAEPLPGEGQSTLVADTVAIINCIIYDYSKALYDNSKKNASSVDYLIFDGLIVDNCSNGADYIDMRAGAYHNLIIRNSTFSNTARTFVRTDATCEINTVLIKNNTLHKIATNASSKDNNGLFHIRSTAGAGVQSYTISDNLFSSIKFTEAPAHANGYPKFISTSTAAIKPTLISNNYFYNIEEEFEGCIWWNDNCTRAEGLAGNGVVLVADPFLNAENLDFTLTNAVAMTAGVGDPRWNPMGGGSPSSEITVASVEDLLTAISAGKKSITLKAGTYDLTTITDVEDITSGVYTLKTSLSLDSKEGAVLVGGIKLAGDAISTFSINGVNLDGANTIGNMIEIADATVNMKSISVKNSNITGYKNRLAYMNVEATITSVEFSGLYVNNMGTGGDFFDVRKGTLTALRFKNNTFANGIRTFMRIDAAVVCGSIYVGNNTFYNLCAVDSKDNNGICHVRATSLAEGSFVLERNIFASMHRAVEAPANTAGYPKIVSSNSASKVPVFRGNLFYDLDTAESFNWWNSRVTAEEATADGGAVLESTPFASASPASDGYAVLAAYQGFGDPNNN